MFTKPLRGKRLKDIKFGNNNVFNARTIAVPIVAFTMASLLFVYTRSSIYAAKRNAERHRNADGGQISWRNESLRRHGALQKPEEKLSIKEMLGGSRDEKSEITGQGRQSTVQEDAVRARKIKRGNDEG